MKVLTTIEFDFGNIDAKLHELIKKSVEEQMEIAEVYFTVDYAPGEQLELTPIRITTIAATIGR